MLPGGGAGVTPVYLRSKNLLGGNERPDFQLRTERQKSNFAHLF